MTIADHEFSPDVRVNLDSQPLLTLVPRHQDGAQQAAAHLAKQAQRTEREQAIADRLDAEGADMLRRQVLDSHAATHVAAAMPMDLSAQDRYDAAAVAVRLHEPRWQLLSRYHSADAILVELRKSQREHGWYLAESDLRKLADHLASVSLTARLRVWTNQTIVSARDWTRAALGLLSVTEER